MIIEFEAELWLWEVRSDRWTFVSLPVQESEIVRDAMAPYEGRGFGSVRVQAAIGATVWRTSIFPDRSSGCYVLPVKAAVRIAEDLAVGKAAQIQVRLVDLS